MPEAETHRHRHVKHDGDCEKDMEVLAEDMIIDYSMHSYTTMPGLKAEKAVEED